MNVMNLNTYDNGLYVGPTPISYDVVLSGNKAEFTFDTSNLMGSKVIVQNTSEWFVGSNVKSINLSTDLIDQNYSVQNTCNMFSGCQYLEHVEGFNFSNIEDGFSMFNNCCNLVMEPINIKVKNGNGYNMYSRCSNLVGSPVMDDNITIADNMYYNCSNLTGSPELSENTLQARFTYQGCVNLTGSPVCPDNLHNMYQTYSDCSNLTGSPIIGKNVNYAYSCYSGCSNLDDDIVWESTRINTNVDRAFCNCYKLPGPPKCPDTVNSSSYTYYNCYSMQGSPVVSSSVKTCSYMYYNCTNLTGSPALHDSIDNAGYMYANCVNLSGSITLNRLPGEHLGMFEDCKGGLHIEVDPSLGSTLYNGGVPESLFGSCNKYTAPKQYANGVYYQEVEFENGGTLEWTAGYDRLYKKLPFSRDDIGPEGTY